MMFKTWKEMEAKTDDFDKVLMVVRKQLLSVLDQPVKEIPTTVEAFKVAQQTKKKRKKERKKERRRRGGVRVIA